MKTIKATDAVRTFIRFVLNSVKYKGDRYTIVRGFWKALDRC